MQILWDLPSDYTQNLNTLCRLACCVSRPSCHLVSPPDDYSGLLSPSSVPSLNRGPEEAQLRPRLSSAQDPPKAPSVLGPCFLWLLLYHHFLFPSPLLTLFQKPWPPCCPSIQPPACICCSFLLECSGPDGCVARPATSIKPRASGHLGMLFSVPPSLHIHSAALSLLLFSL